MKITMFNVNFGEAIAYEEENELLLVDCGAYHIDKGYKKAGEVAYKAVKEKINDKDINKKKLLITHFHRDHFNGINEMKSELSNFSEIYLPYYYYNDGCFCTGDLFDEYVKIGICSCLMGRKNNIEELYKLFKNICAVLKTGKVKKSCVGENDKVVVGNEVFNVIWPPKNGNKVIRNSGNEERFNELFLFLEKVHGYGIRKKIEDMCQIIREIYMYFRENDIKSYGNVDYITEIVGKMVELYKDINEEGANYKEILITKKEVLQREFGVDFIERKNRLINTLNSKNIKDMNSCSVVMHIEKKVLALGDITKPIMDILKNKLCNEYMVIKTAHHGTEAHYYDGLPNTEVFLISNGGKKHMNWKIFSKYKWDYSNTKVLCTNLYPSRCNCMCFNNMVCTKCLAKGINKKYCICNKISSYITRKNGIEIQVKYGV